MIVACGALSLGGAKGRLVSLAFIFSLFFANHGVLGVSFPPLVPVVAANVVALLANVYESLQGGSMGKWAYFLEKVIFGVLFLAEPAFLVQDPFTYAVEGTDALLVGQKLGFAVGMVLCMHAAMALFEPPTGCIMAVVIVMGGMAKMAHVDNVQMPAASLGAAAVTLAICAYDLFKNGADEKEKGKTQ